MQRTRGRHAAITHNLYTWSNYKSWADKVRKGKLAVRANADTGADAKNAREFGAEGIGLCRTEHMFLGEDRLPVVQGANCHIVGSNDGDGEGACR